MKVIHIKERGGNELGEYKRALKMAKEAIETICDLTEEMEGEFGERRYDPYRMDYRYDGYGERYDSRGDYSRRDWDDMSERRRRNSRGLYM